MVRLDEGEDIEIIEVKDPASTSILQGAIYPFIELMKKVREAKLTTYLRLTHEATLCASWYRRMVQGVLKIDHADADRGNET